MPCGRLLAQLERIGLGGGDKRLSFECSDEGEESLISFGVEFTGDVIHEEDGLLAQCLGERANLGDFRCEDESSVLSLGREVFEGLLLEGCGEVVAVRSNGSKSSSQVVLSCVVECVEESFFEVIEVWLGRGGVMGEPGRVVGERDFVV